MGLPAKLLVTLGIAGLLVLATVTASAQVPDPALSTVPNVVYTPGGTIPYSVNVQSSVGPVVGALVEIVFSAAADTSVCWCQGQTHPVISGVTDVNGDVSFSIFAGGCIDPAQDPNMYVEVYADGVLLNTVGAVSPDAVDGTGLFPWSGWMPGGECSAGLGDWVVHTNAIITATYTFCSDMNSDGVVGIFDAVLLTAPIALGEVCVQGP